MATTRGTETDLLSLLRHLIQLDEDAIDAYQAAIDRLEHAETKSRLREFMGDHERHTKDLGRCMVQHGAAPPNRGDYKSLLTTGKVQMAALVGDRAILQAMRSNENDTNQAYEQALNNAITVADEDVRAVLERGLQDERRHRAWIEAQLG